MDASGGEDDVGEDGAVARPGRQRWREEDEIERVAGAREEAEVTFPWRAADDHVRSHQKDPRVLDRVRVASVNDVVDRFFVQPSPSCSGIRKTMNWNCVVCIRGIEKRLFRITGELDGANDVLEEVRLALSEEGGELVPEAAILAVKSLKKSKIIIK